MAGRQALDLAIVVRIHGGQLSSTDESLMDERFPTANLEHREIKMGHTLPNAGPNLYYKRRLPRKRMYEN